MGLHQGFARDPLEGGFRATSEPQSNLRTSVELDTHASGTLFVTLRMSDTQVIVISTTALVCHNPLFSGVFTNFESFITDIHKRGLIETYITEVLDYAPDMRTFEVNIQRK